jgi:hypothetical protein
MSPKLTELLQKYAELESIIDKRRADITSREPVFANPFYQSIMEDEYIDDVYWQQQSLGKKCYQLLLEEFPNFPLID